MRLKAVFFDLYGTVAFLEKPLSGRFVSDFLVSRGYEVYPQALDAAWHYVSFVDYPRFGFESWEMWLRQICNRLGVNVDNKTIKEWSSLYEDQNWKLYPDVPDAFNMAKMLGLKTAIVTSIAKFMYINALKPILGKVDLLVDAFTFHCEKSNPKIYREALKTLKIKPEEAVMIGDEVDVDILLPKRLGMHAIFLNRGGKAQKSSFEVELDAIANNLVEAMKIVECWIVSGK